MRTAYIRAWMRAVSSASWTLITHFLASPSTGAHRRVEGAKLKDLSGNVYSNILRKIKTKKQWLRSVSHIFAASFALMRLAMRTQSRPNDPPARVTQSTQLLWYAIPPEVKSSLAQKRQKRPSPQEVSSGSTAFNRACSKVYKARMEIILV